MYQFIKVSKVREAVHKRKKLSSRAFETYIDKMVDERIEAACRLHNGGHKKLDETVAAHVSRL